MNDKINRYRRRRFVALLAMLGGALWAIVLGIRTAIRAIEQGVGFPAIVLLTILVLCLSFTVAIIFGMLIRRGRGGDE